MRFRQTALSIALALGLMEGLASAASIPEPSTVFYGKVIGTDAAQPFLITEGTLEWVVSGPNNTSWVFSTELQPLNDGAYSYRLDVPHEALSYGLEVSDSSIPLTQGIVSQGLGVLRVNGLAAEIAAPGQPWFDVAQAMRAATYRLDMTVGVEPLDTDGDGLPDWWEDLHGYDKNDPNDANGDLDGDGVSALGEYSEGSDPERDSREPDLVTESIQTFAGGWSGVHLLTRDVDSAAEDLIYTLIGAPEGGDLALLDAEGSTQILEVGAEFSQADLNAGRLFANVASETAFDLSVRDENPEHSPDTGSIVVASASANGSESDATIIDAGGWVLGADGAPDIQKTAAIATQSLSWIAWDNSSVGNAIELRASSAGTPSSSGDAPQLVIGGAGSDQLAGSENADRIIGGRGDDLLLGGGNADRFVYLSADSGSDVIEDLSLEEGDVIDLSIALSEASGLLEAYVTLGTDGSDPVLQVDTLGVGNGHVDFSITLRGLDPGTTDLYSLTSSGALETGALGLTPRLSFSVETEDAAENGAKAGKLVIQREGGLGSSLTANLSIAGSASNGVDYASIPSVVTFPSGASSVELKITPFADSVTEPDESVEISLLEGEGYALGGVSQATLTIRDLAPSLSLEVIERLAERESNSPAQLLIRRDGLINRSVFVRLDIGGDAIAGVDYERIPSFINLDAGQTTELIQIFPKPGEGSPSVRLSFVEDRAYLIAEPSEAEAFIVEKALTFESWLAEQGLVGPEPRSGKRDFVRFRQLLSAYALENGPADYELNDGHLVLSFEPRPAVTDIDYEVSHSFGFGEWSQDSTVLDRFTPEGSAEPGVQYYRTVVNTETAPTQFLRLHLNLRP